MTQPQEEWRPVVGHEGAYEVSSFGRVRSVGRTQQRRRKTGGTFTYNIQERILVPSWEGGGTGLRVSLGRSCPRKVHHLVLEAFVGPRPEGSEGLHGDDDPANNTPGNLSWGSHTQNMADASTRGRVARGERNANARLTASQVLEIYALCSTRTDTQIAPLFGVARETVKNIRRRDRWKHVLPAHPVNGNAQGEINRRRA